MICLHWICADLLRNMKNINCHHHLLRRIRDNFARFSPLELDKTGLTAAAVAIAIVDFRQESQCDDTAFPDARHG